RCLADRPDLVLMDLLRPGLDGVETTRRIMSEAPCPILVVTASIEGRFTQVYEAISAGALDAVETPTLDAGGSLRGSEALLRKVAMIGSLTRPGATRLAPFPAAPDRRGAAVTASRRPPIVAIGASTGGPSALSTVLGALPADTPASVIVVQHLDARFTAGLVASLGERTALKVEAVDKPTPPRRGTVHVAAREAHLILDENGVLGYVEDPVDVPHRPSIDMLFASLAACPSAAGCGVLLTGMGRDGAAGLLALRRAGFLTLAQNEASSVVWGIPGAAVALGAAGSVLPLDELAPAIRSHLRTLRAASAADREHL
ncbi:MAG: chemotaxis-specific protein-glutamate methyltransferase CheB, partial [Gammaproteobacteria bacterium]|nr:chemotaxis-specific protein-glutamate methyltransferase CheB [Gammaproteobacteria bacterium]